MERGFETSNWWKMRVLGGKFDVFQKRSDTVGELKTGCKTGQESTILSRPKALIRAFGGFANSIRSLLEQPEPR